VNPRAVTVFVVVGVVVLGLASLVDRPLWRLAERVHPLVAGRDWIVALKTLGYLPVWLTAAAALYLVDRSRPNLVAPAAARGLLLAVSVVAAGCLGEVLKLLLRRLGPDVTGGEYAWRPFAERTFSTVDLGMPSGHAIVAFAAAWALCRLFPAARALWVALACGCAATRVLSGAHFLSDTVLSAVTAFAVVRCAWSFSPRPRPASDPACRVRRPPRAHPRGS
jgi:membrane-associated phospholipid phosphatase